MESDNDSDFSGSEEEMNESTTGEPTKTLTVSIVVPKTTSEPVENGKERSHDAKPVQQVIPPGLKESPKLEKKRSRLKDDLAISPDQTKIGKRQRKVNSLYSGYAIDKKTTQFLSQNASPTITEPASALQLNKREIIMSPAEAQKRQSKLPKGYAYEPIYDQSKANAAVTPSTETPPPSAKRERKKKKENPEFVDPNSPGQDETNPVTEATIETPATKTRSKRARGSTTPITPTNTSTEELHLNGGPSSEVQTITVHPIVERKLDEDEDVVVEEEEDDDYLSESEEEFEEGNKKKRGYYRTKKQTLQMQLQELQSKLDLVTQNLAAAQQNTPGSQSQSSNLGTSQQKVPKRRGPPPGRKNKKKEKDTFLDSDYEEDYDSDDSYTKKSRKKITTSPTIRGTRGPGRRKKEDVGTDVNKELSQCKRILQAMMKHASSWPFNQPVDPVALGIMDYFDIVKQPMDLRTIMEGLNAGDYLSADDFAADVRLVWRNAITYNGINHTISKMAQTLSQFFEKKFLKVRPFGALSSTPATLPTTPSSVNISGIEQSPTGNSSIKQHMQSTISELRDSMIQMREEIQALRKEKAAAATAAKQMARQSAPGPGVPKQRGPGRPKTKNKPTPIHKSVTREDARPMTFEEKRILSENINLLDAEALGKVVQLIHQRMPNLAQNGNDEIEIDIDAMDAATLRHLEKFVKNSLSKLRKRGGSAPPTKIHAAADLVAQNTSKSIQDVKQRLQELSTRSTAFKKKKIEEEGNEDVVIDDVQDENKNYPSILIEPDSSSSSDSSSDSDSSSSSSSSSSDSDSSGPEKKKKKKDKHLEKSIPPVPITVTIDKAPVSEQKDNVSLSPAPPVSSLEPADTKKEEEPQILHPAAVSKDVELKNMDAWKLDLDAWDTPAVSSSTTSPASQAKDETWSQFQNRDLQNQLREKEREERDRKEKEERELERKKQEEQRLKELAEAEENKKRAEQEENERKQKEIEAKREAARKAREQMSSQRSVMDQSIMMQSFEMNHDTDDKPAILDAFKLKQDDLADRAPPREEGEV